MFRDRLAPVRIATLARSRETAPGAATLLLTQRLIGERTRREIPSLAGPRPLVRVPPEDAAGPSRRAASPAPGAPGRDAGREPYATQAPAQPIVPPIDVERLTDQVVRRIDERIVAFRERMGKVF